jgi:hypothetical protein
MAGEAKPSAATAAKLEIRPDDLRMTILQHKQQAGGHQVPMAEPTLE